MGKGGWECVRVAAGCCSCQAAPWCDQLAGIDACYGPRLHPLPPSHPPPPPPPTSLSHTAYRPANPADPTPIQPGETTQLKNTQTGKYCRLTQLPAGYVSPTTCNTQGVICDQDTIATATILTYTGSGLSYNGVPLVEVAPSKTLVLSADASCTVPGGDKLTFPLATLRELPRTLALSVMMLCSINQLHTYWARTRQALTSEL